MSGLINFLIFTDEDVTGFLFVTVSSRLVGEIGSSSNPISGMTIATLMLTSLIFVAVGWTRGAYPAVALSVGGIVCVISSYLFFTRLPTIRNLIRPIYVEKGILNQFPERPNPNI